LRIDEDHQPTRPRPGGYFSTNRIPSGVVNIYQA
jgi:hypothetical protein